MIPQVSSKSQRNDDGWHRSIGDGTLNGGMSLYRDENSAFANPSSTVDGFVFFGHMTDDV
jgi:hypothetical protein